MKQVILVRDDIDMTIGKTVAQGSHVSVLATRKAEDNLVNNWIESGGKKIVLRVGSESELREIINGIENIPVAMIEDLGYTELDPGTLTAGAIGPANEEKIDEHTGHLNLFD
jgi:PTH2 family peptidyl-tRNA hydrolase